MTPYYDDGQITIYHGDCREILPTLEPVDLVLTDPPYGIGINDHQYMKLGKGKKNYMQGSWDERQDVRPLLSAARYVCIWGGNYYADQLPPTNDWLCWHKLNDGRSFSEFELAWTNFGKNARHFQRHWSGEEKNHPTQKPLVLMRWCISLAPQAETILDPFGGSGTTARAALDMGRRCILIEREERYCEIAVSRLSQQVLPLDVA